MAAGGTFTPGTAKIRPGTYINFKSTRESVSLSDTPGVAVVPLFFHSYGKAGFVEINASNVGNIAESLGYDIYSDNSNILLIREALKVCNSVLAYPVVSGGATATTSIGSLVATAKYAGSRGNDIRIVISANVTSGFDISIYLGADKKYEYTGVATVEEAAALDCPYVDFSALDGSDEGITETAGTELTGGVDGDSTNSDYTTFLDALDHTVFTAVCLPVESTSSDYSTMAAAFASKIIYLIENVGKTVVGVMPNYAANHIAIINVTNAPIVDDVELTAAQATAWVAGLYAGSTELDNNTNVAYEGATGFTTENLLSHEAIEVAITNGEFVFSLSDDGTVVVEYDINSLTTPDETQDESYKKNRVIRTFYAITNAIKENFPIGKYSATDEDYDVMDGVGASLLSYYQDEGAIKNVADGDFAVDRTSSGDDAAYYDVAIQAVDSIVKNYFTVSTR